MHEESQSLCLDCSIIRKDPFDKSADFKTSYQNTFVNPCEQKPALVKRKYEV